MKKILKRTLIAVAGLAVAAIGIRYGMIWNKTRDVLPEFKPVPEGPRAPEVSLAGVVVGRSTLAEVQALTASAGYLCRDTSMRGLMQQGREAAQKKMADAEAEGKDPDTVSGASRAHYYSKKEQNPQVQWSCEEADLSKLDTGLAAGGEKGSVMFIFDSKDLPLRHVLTSRHFMSQSATQEARLASMKRFESALGPSHNHVGKINENPEQKMFARNQVVADEWSFADRKITVTVFNRGPQKGIALRDSVEVPWPITAATRRD